MIVKAKCGVEVLWLWALGVEIDVPLLYVHGFDIRLYDTNDPL